MGLFQGDARSLDCSSYSVPRSQICSSNDYLAKEIYRSKPGNAPLVSFNYILLDQLLCFFSEYTYLARIL